MSGFRAPLRKVRSYPMDIMSFPCSNQCSRRRLYLTGWITTLWYRSLMRPRTEFSVRGGASRRRHPKPQGVERVVGDHGASCSRLGIPGYRVVVTNHASGYIRRAAAAKSYHANELPVLRPELRRASLRVLSRLYGGSPPRHWESQAIRLVQRSRQDLAQRRRTAMGRTRDSVGLKAPEDKRTQPKNP